MSVKIPIADVTTAVWYGLLLVRLWRKDPESSVLPIVIGVTSSNHSGCGGLRRRVTKACPICSSRVAKPAFAVPIGDSPPEGFPTQFDLALHVSLLGGDLHTQERSQYCRTGFPICSSRFPLGHSCCSFRFWPLQKDRASCMPVQLPSTRVFSGSARFRNALPSNQFVQVCFSLRAGPAQKICRHRVTCKACGTR